MPPPPAPPPAPPLFLQMARVLIPDNRLPLWLVRGDLPWPALPLRTQGCSAGGRGQTGVSGGQGVGPLPVVEGLQADGSRCKEHRLTKAGGVTQTQGKHAGQAQAHHLWTDTRVRQGCASKGPGYPLLGYPCWLNLKWTDPIR